ncbi:TetR/AcrR family transcriptional regulator [Marinospirillum perlucidum]|uniref:TetR/AcrR family transcriptional regulator n=1 Tax=Marinospirillum perlucidum TaxID=1982602 RepID=UPI000DF1424E|nr:TetR/AcrR family transcriptional regulator [Marinospirillum perlucidum]
MKKQSTTKTCQDKRQQIIQAASEAFLQKGYQNASMETIACEAGVAKQTLYNYFGNKDALFEEVVNLLCTCENEQMRSEDISSDRVEAVFHAYAQGLISDLLSIEDTALFRMMVAEALHFPNLGKMFFQAGMEKDRKLLVEFLTRQHAAGNLVIDDANQAALLIQGALNAYFRPKFIMTGESPSPEEMQKHIDYCIEKILKLYRP